MKFAIAAGLIVILISTYPMANAVSANITGYYDRPQMELLPVKITSQRGSVTTIIFQVEGEVRESIMQHMDADKPSNMGVIYKVLIKEKKGNYEYAIQSFAFSNKAAFPGSNADTPVITMYDKSVMMSSSAEEIGKLLFDVRYTSFLAKSLFGSGRHLIFAEVTAAWNSDLVGKGSVTERSFTYQIVVK
jgi:hypothetical protein